MWREFQDPFETCPLGAVASGQRANREGTPPAPCFYTDEHFPVCAIELLRSAGAQVCTAADADLLDQPGEAHADYALAQGFVLLTCDAGFMDERQFPLDRCPAVFIFDFGTGTLRDVRRALRCLAPVLTRAGSLRIRCKVEAESDAWIEHHCDPNGVHARVCRRLWHGKVQEWDASCVVHPSSC